MALNRREARLEKQTHIEPSKDQLRDLKRQIPGIQQAHLMKLRQDLEADVGGRTRNNMESIAQKSDLQADSAQQAGRLSDAFGHRSREVAAHQVSRKLALEGDRLDTPDSGAQERREIGREAERSFRNDVELTAIMQEEGISPVDLVAGGETTERAIRLVYANEPAHMEDLLAQLKENPTPNSERPWLELKARADELKARGQILKELTNDIDEGVHNPIFNIGEKWGLKPLMENLNPMEHPMEFVLASVALYLGYDFIKSGLKGSSKGDSKGSSKGDSKGDSKGGSAKNEAWGPWLLGWAQTAGKVGVGAFAVNYFMSHYTRKGVGMESSQTMMGYENATARFQEMLNGEVTARESYFDDQRAFDDTVIGMGHASMHDLVNAYRSAQAHSGLNPELDVHALFAQDPDNVANVGRLDNSMDRQAAFEGTQGVLVLYARKMMGLKGGDKQMLAAQACEDIMKKYGPDFELRMLIAEILTGTEFKNVYKDPLLKRGPESAADLGLQDRLKEQFKKLGVTTDLFVQNGFAYIKGYPFEIEGDGSAEKPFAFVHGTERFEVKTATESQTLTSKATQLVQAALTAAGVPSDSKYDRNRRAYEVSGSFPEWKFLNNKGDDAFDLYVSFDEQGKAQFSTKEGSGALYERLSDVKESEVKARITEIVQAELSHSLGAHALDFERVVGPDNSGTVQLEWGHGLGHAKLGLDRGHIRTVSELRMTPDLTAEVAPIAEREAQSVLASDPSIRAALDQHIYKIREQQKNSLTGWIGDKLNPWNNDRADAESALGGFKEKVLADLSKQLSDALGSNPAMTPAEWQQKKTDIAKAVALNIGKHRFNQVEKGEYNPEGMVRPEHPEWDDILTAHDRETQLSLTETAFAGLSARLDSRDSYPVLRNVLPGPYQIALEQWKSEKLGQIRRVAAAQPDLKERGQSLVGVLGVAEREIEQNLARNNNDPEKILAWLESRDVADSWKAELKLFEDWLDGKFAFEGYSYTFDDPTLRAEVIQLFKDKADMEKKVGSADAKAYREYFQKELTVLLGKDSDLNWKEYYVDGIKVRQISRTEWTHFKPLVEQIPSISEPRTHTAEVQMAHVEYTSEAIRDLAETSKGKFDSEFSLNGYCDWLIGSSTQFGDMGWNQAFREHFNNRVDMLASTISSGNVDEFRVGLQKLEAAMRVERDYYRALLTQSVQISQSTDGTPDSYPLVNVLTLGLGFMGPAAATKLGATGLKYAFLRYVAPLAGAVLPPIFDMPSWLMVRKNYGDAMKDNVQNKIQTHFDSYMKDTSTDALVNYKKHLDSDMKSMIAQAVAADSRLASLSTLSINW